jgi:hypothetical protein
MSLSPRMWLHLARFTQFSSPFCLFSSDDKMPSLYYCHATFKWQRAALSSDRVMSSHKGRDSIRILTRLRLVHCQAHPLRQGLLMEKKGKELPDPLSFLWAMLHCSLEPAVCGSMHSHPSVHFDLKLPFPYASFLSTHLLCSGFKWWSIVPSYQSHDPYFLGLF